MGKVLDGSMPVTMDEIRARMNKRYEGVPFTHPDPEWADIPFQLSILSNGEKEHINTASGIGTPTMSGWIFNRLTVAYGVIVPEQAAPLAANATRGAREARAMRIADSLKDFTDDYILPLAEEVWRLTNAYQTQREGGSESTPFSKQPSGSSSGSLTAPASTLISSKGGAKSD